MISRRGFFGLAVVAALFPREILAQSSKCKNIISKKTITATTYYEQQYLILSDATRHFVFKLAHRCRRYTEDGRLYKDQCAAGGQVREEKCWRLINSASSRMEAEGICYRNNRWFSPICTPWGIPDIDDNDKRKSLS